MLLTLRKPHVVLGALLCLLVATHSSAAGELAVHKGDPLAAALDHLRNEGLQIIFSSALIGPELRVDVEPGSGSPEDVARRILAPHGLTLEPIRPGLFAVVKADAKSPANARTGPGTPSESVASDGSDALYEIDVYASRYKIESQPSQQAALAELSREDIETLPGLNQDVLRVTHFLPGTAANALSARSHVRGGREDELAVFFDGVPLFEPFHYKDVQSLLGMLDPESISTVDFFSGVFPVRYGNRLSGVLDIQPRISTGDANYNAIGASVLYSHALTQGHLDSHPLEWLVSVRHGNVDLFADLIGRRETEPDFLDALGRVKFDLTPQMSLIAGWLLLDDELEANFPNGTERGDIEYRDATGWLSWRYRTDDDFELRATASRTERHTNREGSVDQPGNSQGSLDDRRVFDTTALRFEASTRALEHVAITSGIEWYGYDANYRYTSNATFDPALAAAFGRAPTYSQSTTLVAEGEAYAAYSSATLGIAPRTTLDLSLRWDAQRFDAAFNDNQLSPRVSLQYDYDPATIFRLSWGRASQTARPDELQVQEGDTTFPVAQRATQIALSAERHLTPRTLLRIETYDKRVHDPAPSYENLLDPFTLLPELEVDRVRIQPDRSHMYGAELSLRWQLPERWSGWTSYSWSQATDHFGPSQVLRTWDQKHSLATGVAWAKGPWTVSSNATWHTGWRRNELVTTPSGALALAPLNSDHWPAYFSLDVRTGWTHSLPRGSLDAFFEIDNLTNHENPCCSEFRPSASGAGAFSREETSWLPRLFLLGVTWQLP